MKRSHEYETSDFDKELTLNQNADLKFVLVHPSLGGWIEVKKKKGEKGQFEDNLPR
jgi:hypothetical protein